MCGCLWKCPSNKKSFKVDDKKDAETALNKKKKKKRKKPKKNQKKKKNGEWNFRKY